VIGIVALIPAAIGTWAASAWKPTWPWWAYYCTMFPCSLAYSVFLCCQLVALISGVDSKSMPRATALLYTIRSLGVTMGISIGGSIQLGALSTQLRSRFWDVPNREQIVTSILHSKSAIRLLPESLQIRALDAYAASISTVWVVSGVVSVLTIIAACFMQEKDVHGKTLPDKVRGTGGGAVDELGDLLGAGTINGESAR